VAAFGGDDRGLGLIRTERFIDLGDEDIVQVALVCDFTGRDLRHIFRRKL